MRTLSLLVFLFAVPVHAADQASCSLAAGSHAEATLSPPIGEDEDFLGRTSSGGLPYIAFVIDTSEWMRKFPVDLTAPSVRAQGLGCSNPVLNALTYQANPCINGKGQFVNYGGANCSSSTLQPAGFGAAYSSTRKYAPFDADLTGLFSNNRYYVFDRGWGAKSTEVAAGWAFHH